MFHLSDVSSSQILEHHIIVDVIFQSDEHQALSTDKVKYKGVVVKQLKYCGKYLSSFLLLKLRPIKDRPESKFPIPSKDLSMIIYWDPSTFYFTSRTK